MAFRSKFFGIFKSAAGGLDLNDPEQRRQAVEQAVEQYLTVWQESSDPQLAAEKLVPAIKAFKELNLDTLPIFQLAVRRNPADAPLTLYVADKLLESGDESDEALQCYRRALQIAPDPLPYYLALERIYRKRDDTVNLCFIFEQYVFQYQRWEQERADGRLRLDETQQAQAAELMDRALPALVDFYVSTRRCDKRILPILERALERFPESVGVIELVCLIYQQEGRSDERAIEAFETLLAYKQDCWPVTEQLAEHYFRQKRWGEAIALFRALYEAADQIPKRLHFLVRIVEAALALPDLPAETLPYLQEFLARNPDDDKVLAALGRHFAAAQSLTTEALAVYQKLHKRGLSSPDVQALLGRHALESRNWLDVIELFEPRYRDDPANPDVVFALASAYCEFDRTDAQAIAVYEAAVKLKTTNRTVYQILSRFYFEKNLTSAKAVRCYKETLSRIGSDEYARLGLCLSHLHNHEFEACFDEAVRLLKRQPDHSQAASIAAQALAGNPTTAMIEVLSRLDPPLQKKILEAASSKKTNKTLLLKLADIYLSEGEPDAEHEALLEQAWRYSPRNVRYLEALSSLAHRGGDWKKALDWDTRLYAMFISSRGSTHQGDAGGRQGLTRLTGERICRRLTHLLLDHDADPAPEISNIFRDAFAFGLRDARLVRRLAADAAAAEDTTAEAEAYYRALIEIEPDNLDAQVMLHMCLLERRDIEPIYEFCEAQLRKGCFDPRLFQLLLQVQTQTRKAPESLIRVVDKLWIQHKDNKQVLLCLAHLYACAERATERAIEIYEKALELEPGNTFLVARLAKAYETTGRVEQSIARYQQILQTLPEDAEILARLAQAYYIQKDTSSEALKTTKRAVELNPENARLAIYLVHIYHRLGFYRRIVQVIDGLLERQPAALNRAVACLEELVQNLDPDNLDSSRIPLKLGQLYLKQGRINEAFAMFTHLDVHYETYCGELIEGYGQVIARDPTHVPARVERAVLFKLAGDYDAAIKDLEQIAELVAEDSNVLYELLEVYELSIAASKTPPLELIFKAGYLAMRIEEFDKAIALFQKILQRDRQNFEAMLAVGRCFHRKGALELAMNYYRQIEKNETVLELLYDLADIAYAAQQRKLALQALNEIVAVDITYRDVSRRAAELEAELSVAGESPLDKTALGGEDSARRFDLLNVIGKGSMGIVYKAYDRELSEYVALKVLPPEFSNHPEVLERFRREARAARRLTHRNIVRIHDIGEEGGQRFITMELIEGQNLRALIRNEKRLSPSRAIPIAVQVAKALQYAHSMNILHRDIKPANILITPNSVVKLTDFGIAAMVEEFSRSPESADVILGTPLYMSPEQAEGRPLSFASEVYSLGVVMFEMLAGEPPFTTGNIIYHHMFTPPPLLTGVPEPLAAIVMKCLEKNPENRFPTMDKLIEALQRVPLT
ncbi:MAG: hypothetical protein Kow0059_06170 [Candidatus Sumerlaeia bacterium]